MSYSEPEEFFKEAFDLFAGDLIGEGIARKVFTHQRDESLVIKVERENSSFQNVKEWEFWQWHRLHKGIKEWLAPCVAISARGQILIQKRVFAVARSELPDKLPGFLTDTKPENFGRYKGRIVCHDYAITITNPSTRLRKVRKWN